METNTPQILQDKFASLPVELQQAITESGFIDKLRAISKDEKLMIDQGGALETEVLMVLLGVEALTSFEDNLIKELRLDKEKAKRISDLVGNQIFSPIHVHLEHLMSAEENAPTNIIETPLNNNSAVMNPGMDVETNRLKILEGIENPITSFKREEKRDLPPLAAVLPKNSNPTLQTSVLPASPTIPRPPIQTTQSTMPSQPQIPTAQTGESTGNTVNNLITNKFNGPLSTSAEKLTPNVKIDPYKELPM